jgi:hypothetical protein
MTTASIPAAKVMHLHAAIVSALQLASDTPGAVQTWIALNNAKAIVEVYLVDAMQPVDVKVTESEAA